MPKNKQKMRDNKIAFIMIAPFFLLFSIFVLIPITVNIIFSFTNFNMIEMEFVGFSNYVRLFTDTLFHTAFLNTVVYAVFNVGLTVVLSFSIAVLLNKAGKLIKFARVSFFLPYVTSMIAVSMIWLWLYDPNGGLFNRVLAAFNIEPVLWLLQASTALGSIVVMSVWKNLGYNMVLFLAGLQGVPTSLYEAAEIDGAGPWQKLWNITIPMIKPVTFFVFITNVISSFNVFESVNVMTAGGPMNSTTTIVHQIYSRSFTQFQVGYGASMAIVLSIVVMGLSLFTFKRSGNASQD